jgi:hypothetical protein
MDKGLNTESLRTLAEPVGNGPLARSHRGDATLQAIADNTRRIIGELKNQEQVINEYATRLRKMAEDIERTLG